VDIGGTPWTLLYIPNSSLLFQTGWSFFSIIGSNFSGTDLSKVEVRNERYTRESVRELVAKITMEDLMEFFNEGEGVADMGGDFDPWVERNLVRLARWADWMRGEECDDRVQAVWERAERVEADREEGWKSESAKALQTYERAYEAKRVKGLSEAIMIADKLDEMRRTRFAGPRTRWQVREREVRLKEEEYKRERERMEGELAKMEKEWVEGKEKMEEQRLRFTNKEREKTKAIVTDIQNRRGVKYMTLYNALALHKRDTSVVTVMLHGLK
jgi:hypothetical protein